MTEQSEPNHDAHGAPPDKSAAGAKTQRPRVRRRRPPMLVLLIVAALLILIGFIRWRSEASDFATANALTFICGFLSFAVLAVWFIFFSAFTRRARTVTSLLIVGSLAFAVAAFRVEHVTGELIPTFRPRWAKRPDELLPRPPAATARETQPSNNLRTTGQPGARVADLATTSDHDFPQFFGPQRNGRVDDVELSRDWSAHPPKLIWRHPIGAGWSGFVAVNGYAVTLEQRGPEEFVTCYDIDNGGLIWAHATPARHQTIPGGVGPRSTPTIHAGRVFALGAAGELVCLDGSTGQVIWRDNLLSRFGVPPGEDEKGVAWGRAGSPLVVDELVVVPAGGKAGGPYVALAAYHTQTGELAWRGGRDQVSYSSPVLTTLAGVRQILSVNENTVTGHDPQTGRQLWDMEWPGNSTQDTNVSQPVPIAPDRMLVSKGYGRGAALVQLIPGSDSWTVKDIWRDAKLLKTKFTSVVLYQDHVYGLSDGILECVHVPTGERRWKKGRYGPGQILGVGGVILVQAEMGDVAMVEATPDEFRELGRFPALDGKTWNNLCLTGKRLLVRNAEEAACYELK